MERSHSYHVDPIFNQAVALLMNIYSWAKSFLPPTFIGQSPKINSDKVCIMIRGPGGLDQLQYSDIPSENGATLGYNIPQISSPFCNTDYVSDATDDLVIVRNKYFSVNYADVTIRWGLYESALRYVGWPIVPGFDFAGVVEWTGKKTTYKIGDHVFGFTLFGAYSSRIVVPAKQLRYLPSNITLEKASGIPAVVGTALHAVALAGAWPKPLETRNRAALIHSAAGGVGSMLIQICKLMGYSPVVAVVGNSNKCQICTELGADAVIDKSNTNLWKEAKRISPEGYISIFDANGVDTLQSSYDHLAMCGRLITYGFHTNLPKASHFLSPFQWIRMILGILQMPKFDAMKMVLESKAILGFNLSFFANEDKLIESYMNQVVEWIQQEKIHVANVTIFDMKEIAKAHQLIQSGKSIGKIIIRVT